MIIRRVAFCVWHLAQHDGFKVHSHCSVCQGFILFMVESYSTVWLGHFLFNHASVDGYLGHFHLSMIVTNAAVNECKDLFEHLF